ncbi:MULTISPECIES: bacillithiol biosynthesis deacetylase BshB2 [Paenibacillus]|uniref:Bacillithiol biosynthesis deacetylase BshB2 n=1 Tax=Paenibacillus glycanilyticus TaxID=126569 RepID=A0ABQ6NPK1_9BACL|nr:MULTISPECIES: bacillithiol biosynthesis deacetylase BshB2 [Paenibacillus]MCK9858578.1 bacillithiol biosynthesis deacetylase BshB2 [Paenibacillus sp. ATY16]GMK45914.1 bacillithiol biosynthesis deacetylase BshB2 [Paenibacillus glycanilyticus]
MERILVVLPHPDDEAFTMSGTLAQLIDQGAQVTYACLTLGEMARNMGFPPFASRITLPQIRRGELEESCAAIGIQDLRMLGFHDKTIEFEDKVFLDEHIHALIEEVKPDVIFTFYPGYSVHPDHDATGEAVVRTVGRLPEEERPPVYCVAFSRNHEQFIGKPDISFDVRDYTKNKMASIRAHRSQFNSSEIFGNKQHTDKEVQERLGTERFWTYKFESWK